MGFFTYAKGTILRPKATFTELLNEPKSFRYANILVLAWVILVIPSTIYYYVIGMKPFFPAWLRIPPEEYFFWEVFYLLPVTVLGFLQLAGFIKWIAHWQKAEASFISIYALCAFSLAIPPIIVWWPSDHMFVVMFLTGALTPQEYLTSFNEGGAIFIENMIVPLVGLLWQIILLQIALKVSLGMNGLKTFVLNIFSIAVFYIMWFGVWIR